MLAHAAGHRRWSRPQVADNLSPLQRLAVETFEDARIDHLVLRRFPGLAPVLLAPCTRCPPRTPATRCARSCLRHRLACLSRALLDARHGYSDARCASLSRSFTSNWQGGESSTVAMARLALEWAARTRRQSDQQALVHFKDTVVDWRDDNRHLWTFIEAGDEEDTAPDPTPSRPRRRRPAAAPLPGMGRRPRGPTARLGQRLRHAAPAGAAADIDALLARHAAEARHLKRLLDLLKPQDRTRLRYQEQGSELDLDVALRCWPTGAPAPSPTRAST
jgi:nitric oxide reductase NorD protein